MIRLTLSLAKIAFIAFLTLLFSQVEVKGKRVSEHVNNAVNSEKVRAPIRWIARHFNFSSGLHASKINPPGVAESGVNTALAKENKKETGRTLGLHLRSTSLDSISKPEREQVSGLLKENR